MGEITKTNPLGLRSIKEHNALKFADNYNKKFFQLDWVFDKTYEKLFLVAMLIWSLYSIWRIFFNG